MPSEEHVPKSKSLVVDQWLIEVKPQEFDMKVLKCRKLAIVAFLKDGVASGDILLSVFKRISAEPKTRGGILIFKADVETCREIASRYRISKIPTTLFFIKGKVAAHFIGVVSAQKILGIIETLM